MKKVRFGRTELMVSRIALGGIPIMRRQFDHAVDIVKEALRLGINFIDTANVYGDSELKIGSGIKGVLREELVIASKSLAKDKKTFNEHLDLSLKQLGVNHIDIYQLHNITPRTHEQIFAPGGSFEGLLEAVQAGKVRFPAFSAHSVSHAVKLMREGHFDVVQLPFNFIDGEALEEAIPLARELDMGFIAMKPMGGGMLYDADLSFRYLMQFDSIVPDPGVEKIEELQEIVAVIEAVEAAEAAEAADVVEAVEATATAEAVVDAEEALRGPQQKIRLLSEEDMARIEDLREELSGTWCHRCEYCQPCPQEIPISNALLARSFIKRFSAEGAMSYAGGAVEKARSCLECNECVTRCPYELDIPTLLKENIKFWEEAMPSK